MLGTKAHPLVRFCFARLVCAAVVLCVRPQELRGVFKSCFLPMMSPQINISLWFAKLRRSQSLWTPVVLTFIVGFAASWLIAAALSRQLQSAVDERLQHQAGLFSATLEQRINLHADIVYGMQTAFSTQNASSRMRFAQALVQGMRQRRPGILAVGFTHVVKAENFLQYRHDVLHRAQREGWTVEDNWPDLLAGERDHYEVDYHWSTQGEAPHVVLNVWREGASRDLFERVQRTGTLQMSAPVLMERFGQEPTEGLIVSAPVHDQQAEDSPAHFAGTVNLHIAFDSLVQNLEKRGMLADIVVSIRDMGAWPVIDQRMSLNRSHEQLYQSDGWDAAATAAGGVSLMKSELKLLGRVWQLSVLQQNRSLAAIESMQPIVVGLGGTLASLLLAFIVWLLVKQRARAALQTQARHNRLQHRADRFKALFNQSAVGVVEFDPATGRCKRVNARLGEILDYPTEELEKTSFYNLTAPEDLPESHRLINQLVLGNIQNYTQEYRLVCRTGRVVWVEQWTSPLLDSNGRPSGTYIAMLQDVTQRHEIQQQLREREAYSSDMLRHMPVGLVVLDDKGKVEFINHQFEELCGWKLEEIPSESALWNTLCPADPGTALRMQTMRTRQGVSAGRISLSGDHALMLSTRMGQEVPVDVSSSPMGNRILLSFVDLSERKQAEEEILRLAYYDVLTNLPNRRMLLEELRKRLEDAHATKLYGALLVLDLDNFKTLNETMGYEFGDMLLRLVSTRLLNNLSRQYTLARQGSDEFALLIQGLGRETAEGARQYIEERIVRPIQEALRDPFFIKDQALHVSVCMGAAIFGDDPSLTQEDLLKRADLALHKAKGEGQGTLQFFDPQMQQAANARAEMEKDLRVAMERNELMLYYQPQVEHDRVLGSEALLRWKHPVKGFVSPGVFVPIAEESGLILQLGEWVLNAACRQLAQWADNPEVNELSIAINVSARQFLLPDFVEKVQLALKKTGARPDLLELELTEGMLLTDVDETIKKINTLKEMGIRFALDDFGTGYSSLSYLRRLPLDKLKIDQSFVREVLVNGNDASIACTIVALGHSLGLRVIAEGVETREQRDFLSANGCTVWQGYYFSRPIPDEEFCAWVRKFQNPQLSA